MGSTTGFFSILMRDPKANDLGQAIAVRPLQSSLRLRRSSEYSCTQDTAVLPWKNSVIISQYGNAYWFQAYKAHVFKSILIFSLWLSSQNSKNICSLRYERSILSIAIHPGLAVLGDHPLAMVATEERPQGASSDVGVLMGWAEPDEPCSP